MIKYRVKNKEILVLREKHRKIVMGDQQRGQTLLKRVKNQDPGKSRNNFLNRFFMHSSIQKTVMEDRNFTAGRSAFARNNIVDYLTCDTQWPVCLLDFSFQRKLPSFFIYKIKFFPGFVKDDYFYPEEARSQSSGSMAFSKKSVYLTNTYQDKASEREQKQLIIGELMKRESIN
jgi:hypothetical protein